MTRLILDPTIRTKLTDLSKQIEVCDEDGRTVGYFLPADIHRELIRAWSESQVSDEELDRRSNEPGGRTLKEIWARLNAK